RRLLLRNNPLAAATTSKPRTRAIISSIRVAPRCACGRALLRLVKSVPMSEPASGLDLKFGVASGSAAVVPADPHRAGINAAFDSPAGARVAQIQLDLRKPAVEQ